MTSSRTYYVILDDDSSPDRPVGVFRRIKSDDGQIDEVFSRDMKWEFSPLLYSTERGDTMYDFVEITEGEADEIVARIRADAAQAE